MTSSKEKIKWNSLMMLLLFSLNAVSAQNAFAGNDQVLDPAMNPATPVVEPSATEIPNPPLSKIPGGALSDMEDSALKKPEIEVSGGATESNFGPKGDHIPKSPIKPNVTVNPNPTGECPVKNPDGSCRKLPKGDPNLTIDDPRYSDPNNSNSQNSTLEDPNHSVNRDPSCLAWNPDGTCRKLPENPGDPLNRNIHMGYALSDGAASGGSQSQVSAAAVPSIAPEALADKAKAIATLPVVEAQNPNTTANGNPASVTLSPTVLNQLSLLVGAKKADISVAGVLWTSPDADNNGMFTKHVLLAVKQKDGSVLYYVAVLKGNDPNWTMVSKPELADPSLTGSNVSAVSKSYNPKKKK